MASRLHERYVAEIAPALNKKFGYKSVMQIPKLDKVIVNVRCGESKNNAKEIEAIIKDIDDDLVQLGDLHDALVAELLEEGGSDLSNVLFFHSSRHDYSLLS